MLKVKLLNQYDDPRLSFCSVYLLNNLGFNLGFLSSWDISLIFGIEHVDIAKYINTCKTKSEIQGPAFLINISKGVHVLVFFPLLTPFIMLFFFLYICRALYQLTKLSACSGDGVTMLEVDIFQLKNVTLRGLSKLTQCQRQNWIQS